MGVLVWCCVWWGMWISVRVSRWARGPTASDLNHALALQDDLHPLLQHLARFHPLPEKVHRLIQVSNVNYKNKFIRKMLT